MISQAAPSTPRGPIPAAIRPSGGSPAPPKQEGLRDTIESIVIAFILAFVFRAFLIEAFVIPTGSMAPGLYGKHAQQRCALCGYSWAYGLREAMRSPRGDVTTPGTLELASGFTVTCPNCGWAAGGNAELNTTSESRVAGDSGDRILVFKWPYDIGGEFLGPKRWDVVVFKNPEDGDTNYIKRLIGLPGEVLEIINGDIYAASLSAVPQEIQDALARPPAPGDRDRRRLSPAQHASLLKLLKIQRKTQIAQESLWMIHYHHDFTPRTEQIDHPEFVPPAWRGDESAGPTDWHATTPVVSFTPQSEREQWLRLIGKPIQDEYGYNNVSIHASRWHGVDVGDVRLRFALTPFAESGSLTLNLRKGPDDFRAKIDPRGLVVLDRSGEGGVRFEVARAVIPPLKSGRAARIEFENLDYRVALRINGDEVLATTDEQYAPNLVKLLSSRGYRDGMDNQAGVSIAAQALPLEIRHLDVDRDVFYRSDVEFEFANPLGQRNAFARYPGWGTATNPVLLRSDPTEYFCCGDNSPQSKDGRLWWEAAPFLQERKSYQFGTVPGDQMIGRAFFVYWPSGLRFSKDAPPLVPNVGRMRIIR